jgi:hypothetical protein
MTSMIPNLDSLHPLLQRRTFLRTTGYGLGAMALSALNAQAQPAAPPRAGQSTGAVNPPHHQPRVKRIIHLCMAGGPSHLESFDPKPVLKRLHGQPFPESFTRGQQLAQLQNMELRVRGPSVNFRRWGRSGQEISTLFPHLGSVADEICIIRSMVTEQINHDPAQAFMNSGSILNGRPSMGSWLIYGLGAETENLPGFVVLVSQGSTGAQPVSARQWSSGFLPTRFQGILFQSRGDAVHYINSPDGVAPAAQRQLVEEVNRLNGLLAGERNDPEIQTRIAQYEMAFRMQTSVPELTDFGQETRQTLERYGVQRLGDGSFASNCLLARRLAERGVRFIQLYHRAWDHNGNIDTAMPAAAREVDRPCVALLLDLKQRGLLDDTLVIWGGEFGRTPMGQGTGRDHHILGFSIWLAGGGIKGGICHGNTDELGYRSVENVVTFHDLHATMLHLCGIDHERFSVRFQGLDARLTGVERAKVVQEILTESAKVS